MRWPDSWLVHAHSDFICCPPLEGPYVPAKKIFNYICVTSKFRSDGLVANSADTASGVCVWWRAEWYTMQFRGYPVHDLRAERHRLYARAQHAGRQFREPSDWPR